MESGAPSMVNTLNNDFQHCDADRYSGEVATIHQGEMPYGGDTQDELDLFLNQPILLPDDQLYHENFDPGYNTTISTIPLLSCPCHGISFAKKADLSRHIAKERRLFECNQLNCPSAVDGVKACFGTLNDKKRHYRDVHRMDLKGAALPRFHCPWSYCKRHNEGFPRRANLDNHLARVHDSKRPEGSGLPAAADTTEQSVSLSSAVVEAEIVSPSQSSAPTQPPILDSATQAELQTESSVTTESTETFELAYLDLFSIKEKRQKENKVYEEKMEDLRSQIAVLQEEYTSLSTLMQRNKEEDTKLTEQLLRRRDELRGKKSKR